MGVGSMWGENSVVEYVGEYVRESPGGFTWIYFVLCGIKYVLCINYIFLVFTGFYCFFVIFSVFFCGFIVVMKFCFYFKGFVGFFWVFRGLGTYSEYC